VHRHLPAAFAVSVIILLIPLSSFAQETWRISPEKINVRVGENRRLQLLDDSAAELSDATWTIDNPDFADITADASGVVLHPKAAGTVKVSAALNGEKRFSEVTIWPAGATLPEGTTHWSVHQIGRELRDLPAVPTDEGVDIFSLEQNPSGTILRAFFNDGIQAWRWRVPEITWNVELICGDSMGGAFISANRFGSYTLYAVGKDGQVRWQHTLNGIRKGHAFTLDHLVHILSQSPDGTVTTLTGLDEVTGSQRFELAVPPSTVTQTNLRRNGMKLECVAAPVSTPLRSVSSQVFVNSDGLAYVAFTENHWTLTAPECTPGSELQPDDVSFIRDEKLILWQIHSDGTYRSTVVEDFKGRERFSDPVSVASPTGAIIPDGLNGVLLAVRWSHNRVLQNVNEPSDELVYRISPVGEVIYKLALPRRDGPVHDDMVLGEHELGFATRGGVLVAFNVRSGRELWRWDSNTPEVSVYMATGDGGCVIKTPKGMVLVENEASARQLIQRNATVNWQGQWYRTRDQEPQVASSN